MYHQLCRATGRLVAASNLQSPLFPVVPIALQRAEPPTIQYTTAQMSTVPESSASSQTTKRLIPGTNTPFPPVPESIRKKQELFGKDDGKPVFLKGGPMDVFLYRLTLGLCVLGLAGVAEYIYSEATK